MTYVDDTRWPLGRVVMCHLIADSPGELERTADALGLLRSYIQHPGTWKEHLDVSRSKRALAVRLGAREITGREFVAMLRERRLEEQKGS